MKNVIIILVFCLPLGILAQDGIYSGTLTDSSGPLVGVSIFVVGQNRGVQSDFEGRYRISCSVGDTLRFSYVGMKTKNVVVTASMLGFDNNMVFSPKKPVQMIRSKAYEKALENKNEEQHLLQKSKHTYNNNATYFEYQRIKNIDVAPSKVKLTYFKPDIYYQVGFSSKVGVQYVKDNNLPKLQNTYAQGIPFQGATTYSGPENGTIFSYGPRISNLAFDGTPYEYDINGSLVGLGFGNGQAANTYKNSIYETAVQNSNDLFFNVSTNTMYLGFDYSNVSNKDIYNQEEYSFNQSKLSFNRNHYDKAINWESYITYSNIIDNRPNNNGIHSNILLGTLATPISFSNGQGINLSNGFQRSFSSSFNNPNWLLNNENNIKTNLFAASFQPKTIISDNMDIKGIFTYTHSNNEELLIHNSNTVGFLGGYSKKRTVAKNNFDAKLNFNFLFNLKDNRIKVSSVLDYSHIQLDYNFSESNQGNITNIELNPNRNTVRWLNTFGFSFFNNGLNLGITNNSFISSIQEDEWLLGGIQLKLDINDIFDFYGFRDFSITANVSNNVSDTPLLYGNRSHNSLRITPEESFSYLENNDLFVSDNLSLEKKSNFEISTLIQPYINNVSLSFEFTYFNTKTKDAVFPIIGQNGFELANVADVRKQGYEINFEGNLPDHGDFRYSPSISFSSYRTKTLDVFGQQTVPIAGFSNISKNLVKNQPVGVLIGSAFAQDTNGNTIIDADGFPMVANSPQIIGDPTPKYNIGFSNYFKLNDFSLKFVIDFQKGGDVWNGTQNVLNYLGRSEQSGNERTITDYIFKGVTQQGNTNNILVDFANPTNGLQGNRFIRYGFDGVAESAIEDGSYVNLKSIELKYNRSFEDRLLRNLSVTLYANNLLTTTKFNGRNPYESLYGNASASGLNFFNLPLATEIGCKLKIVL